MQFVAERNGKYKDSGQQPGLAGSPLTDPEGAKRQQAEDEIFRNVRALSNDTMNERDLRVGDCRKKKRKKRHQKARRLRACKSIR
jgi:hypothetical protein